MRTAVLLLSLFALTHSVALRADETPKAPDADKYYLELGGTVGTPAALNLNIGLWTPSPLNLVFRVSGMLLPSFGWGRATGGLQGDLGFAFDREGSFKQFVALTASYRRWAGYSEEGLTVGPTYNANWNGCFFQVGYGKVVSGLDQNRHGSFPLFQLGFVFLLPR